MQPRQVILPSPSMTQSLHFQISAATLADITSSTDARIIFLIIFVPLGVTNQTVWHSLQWMVPSVLIVQSVHSHRSAIADAEKPMSMIANMNFLAIVFPCLRG